MFNRIYPMIISLLKLVINNLKTIKDIPLKISHTDFPNEIDIRGEVFIKTKDFKNIEFIIVNKHIE